MLLTTYPLISSYTHNGDGTLQRCGIHRYTNCSCCNFLLLTSVSPRFAIFNFHSNLFLPRPSLCVPLRWSQYVFALYWYMHVCLFSFIIFLLCFSIFPCLLVQVIFGILSLLKSEIIFHYVRMCSSTVCVSLCLQLYDLFLLLIIYSLLSFLVFLSLVM